MIAGSDHQDSRQDCRKSSLDAFFSHDLSQTHVIRESLCGGDERVHRARMAALGHKPPCGALPSMSAAGGRPDVTGPEADIAILMSAVEGGADINFATAHDRV